MSHGSMRYRSLGSPPSVFVFGHMQINETISSLALLKKRKKEAAVRRRLYAIQEAAEKRQQAQKELDCIAPSVYT